MPTLTADPEVKQAESPALLRLASAASSHLDALDVYLAGQVNEFEPEVREMAAYCLGHSGKRLRPLLVFYSGWRENHPVQSALVQAAAVVELVHLATLVHDDILDAASLRHSTPTAAAKYGSQTAVLLGDALFSHALKLAADFPTPDVCRAVALATRRVCAGEITQTLRTGQSPDLTLATYRRVIDLKTGELFAVSGRLGAQLSGYAPPLVAAIEEFSRRLGTAYQIYDDIVDFLGREQHIGKTLGTDLASGKLTLPVLLLLRDLPAEEALELAAAIQTGRTAGVDELRRQMELRDVPAACSAYFLAEVDAAINALADFHDYAPVPRLLSLSSYVRGQAAKLIPSATR